MSVVAMLIPYNNLYSQMGVPILLAYIYSEGVPHTTSMHVVWGSLNLTMYIDAMVGGCPAIIGMIPFA